MDALTGMNMASTLTENDVGDPSQVAPLLDQVDAEIGSVTADGACDGMPTYDAVAIHGENIAVLIPPPVTSVLSDDAALNPSQRDRHIAIILDSGPRAFGLAERARLRPALTRGDDDESLQGHHWPAPARTQLGRASAPKPPSAWPCSTACWIPHGPTPSATRAALPEID